MSENENQIIQAKNKELEEKNNALEAEVQGLKRLMIAQKNVFEDSMRMIQVLAEIRDSLHESGDGILKQAIDERDEALRKAGFDHLSGLYNRQRFEEQVAAIREQVPDCNVAMLFLDNDWFKKINDSYGHQAGDLVIAAIGRAIKTITRASDFAVKMRTVGEDWSSDQERRGQHASARLGGDEYAILLTGIDGPEDVKRFLERFKDAILQETNTIRESNEQLNELILSFSIGVAMGNWKHLDVKELLIVADEAMYFSKKLKKNRICITQIDPEKAEKRKVIYPVIHNADIESDIRQNNLRGTAGERK